MTVCFLPFNDPNYNFDSADNIETVASTSDKTLVLLPSSYKVTPNDKLYKNIQAKVDTFAKVNTVDTYNQNEIRKAATKGKSKPRRASDVGMPAQQDLLKGALKNMKYSERDLHGLNSESSILPHEDKPDLTYFCGNFLNSQRKHLG